MTPQAIHVASLITNVAVSGLLVFLLIRGRKSDRDRNALAAQIVKLIEERSAGINKRLEEARATLEKKEADCD